MKRFVTVTMTFAVHDTALLLGLGEDDSIRDRLVSSIDVVCDTEGVAISVNSAGMIDSTTLDKMRAPNEVIVKQNTEDETLDRLEPGNKCKKQQAE